MTAKRTLGCGLLVSVVVGVFYWGWCWGWWLRDNLTLQGLLQCNCPAASEAARYQPFRVVVSACREPLVTDVEPSGRYGLLAIGPPTAIGRRILYDFLTGQVVEFTYPGGALLIGDRFVLLWSTDERRWIFDPLYGSRVEVPKTMSDDLRLRKELLASLKSLREIWASGGILVGVPEGATTTADLVIRHVSADTVTWLLENGIMLTTRVDSDWIQEPRPPEEEAWYSAKGELYANPMGLYLTSGDQVVDVRGDRIVWRAIRPTAWVNDDRAVLYGFGGWVVVFQTSLATSHWPVPQPVLVLDVPPQFWPTPSTTATPHP